jgi:hypothetical protein
MIDFLVNIALAHFLSKAHVLNLQTAISLVAKKWRVQRLSAALGVGWSVSSKQFIADSFILAMVSLESDEHVV